MSTIAVARKGGQVAIGADTLSCFGTTKESAAFVANHSKLVRVGDTYLAAVGHTSWQLVLASYFAGLETIPPLSTPEEIFEAARIMHRALKDDFFLETGSDRSGDFETSNIECMIANRHGIFGLYSLRSVLEYTRFYSFGSGYKFALGAMHAAYESVSTAEEVVRAGLLAGAEFDDGTGLPVEIRVIDLAK